MLTTLGLTKTVALEATEHGITVNAICPGYVLTPLSRSNSKRAKARNITEKRQGCVAPRSTTRKFVTTQEIGLALSLRSTAAASGLSIHPADIGWLLVACAPAQSGAILTLIQAAGFNEARIVGEMVEGSGAVVS